MFEERILDSRVDFLLRELLGKAKKEFHDLLVDLVKRKRQSTKENAPRVNANTVLMNDTEVEDEIPNSHYTRPHWARATTETPVRIGNIKEPVLALIEHVSELNLMSKEFYRKGKWPINTNHGWKEDPGGHESNRRPISGLSGCDGEDRGCRDRPKFLRAR